MNWVRMKCLHVCFLPMIHLAVTFELAHDRFMVCPYRHIELPHRATLFLENEFCCIIFRKLAFKKEQAYVGINTEYGQKYRHAPFIDTGLCVCFSMSLDQNGNFHFETKVVKLLQLYYTEEKYYIDQFHSLSYVQFSFSR